MMKISLIRSAFLIAVLPALLYTGCQNAGVIDQRIIDLVSDSTQLKVQRDSLEVILRQRVQSLDQKNVQYDSIAKEVADLESRNKRLASSLNTRTAELKKLEQEKQELTGRLEKTETDINKLESEVESLETRIDEVETTAERQQREREEVERELAETEKRRAADSLSLETLRESIRQRNAESGFENITSFSGGIGLKITDAPLAGRFLAVDNIFGYNINRNWLVGPGIGVNFYNEGIMMPLYLDVRYYLNDKQTSPFFAADGGLVFHFSNFGNSGAFINPQFGLRRKLSNKYAFHFTTGIWTQFAPESQRHSFVSIKGGFSFRPGR
jgi:hypothetical protein